MNRNRPYGSIGHLWLVTASLSVLSMLLLGLRLWPDEDSTEEKLAWAQIEVESTQLYERGYQRHAEGDLAEAIQLYSAALDRKPGRPRTYYMRGIAKLTAGNHEGATEDFSKAIDLAPAFAEALNSRGFLRHESGDKEGALEDFDRAIEGYPRLHHPSINRGYIRKELGDVNGAMRDYGTANAVGRPARWIVFWQSWSSPC